MSRRSKFLLSVSGSKTGGGGVEDAERVLLSGFMVLLSGFMVLLSGLLSGGDVVTGGTGDSRFFFLPF